MLSAPCLRPDDPMGQPLRYRFRGWGRGLGAQLTAQIVAFDAAGNEKAVCGSTTWAADENWEEKEFLAEVPPFEKGATLRVRYLVADGDGAARVDNVVLLPVKIEPEPGVAYTYKVVARDGADAPIGDAVATVSGAWEFPGSHYNDYGLYNWMFLYILVPMEATMFALLAFFIASAAFRAFRARTFEATLLLVAAIFVMIGRVPIGEYMLRPLGDFADWIMDWPNGAAKRAIIIGVGLGMAATSLKLMLGLERAYLGRG
jgi:hypothetical protein